MFDPELHRALRRWVVPYLRTYPSIRVWHAACGTGLEVYGLAILLREEGLEGRATIYATDEDEQVLAEARRGVFPRARIEDEVERYLAGGGRTSLAEYYALYDTEAIVKPALREHLTFHDYDPSVDTSFNEFQLIIWPPRLGALADPAIELWRSSLCRFGVVAVAPGGEPRLDARRFAWDRLDEGSRLYRRVR